MRGRRYRVLIEITYAGGRLPDEAREALASAIRARADRGGADRDAAGAAMTVSADRHNVVSVSATVRADNPREALSELDEVLDDALIVTGLFEEFDVTGKVLRVAPLDRAF
jgi:uncharacterized Ntn-hydrolase superfamily protein